MCLDFEFKCQPYSTPPGIRWNRDLPAAGVIQGYGRQELFDNISARIEEFSDVWNLARKHSLEAMYAVIIGILRSSAQPVYSKHATTSNEVIKLREARDVALRARLHDRLVAQERCRTQVRPPWYCGIRCFSLVAQSHSSLSLADKKVKRAQKSLIKHVQSVCETDLNVAWKARDPFGMWEMARRLAVNQKAPKRRWGNTPLTSRPLADESLSKYELPPSDGGWCALSCPEPCFLTCSKDQILADMLATPPHPILSNPSSPGPPALDIYAPSLARDLSQAIHSKLHKSGPEWDAPTEVWRMVFKPFYLRSLQRRGSGAPTFRNVPSSIVLMVQALLAPYVVFACTCNPFLHIYVLCGPWETYESRYYYY